MNFYFYFVVSILAFFLILIWFSSFAVVNLTLIDLPGLTKVAIGTLFLLSVNFKVLILYILI